MDPCDIEYDLAGEKRSVAFLIDDGTGCALVDATHAEMLLGADVDRWAGEPDGDATAEDAFLARFGQRRRGLLFEKRLYFSESIIEVGERIAVTGTAQCDQGSSSDPRHPYRHHTETALPRLSGAPGSPLLITDDPMFTPPLEDA